MHSLPKFSMLVLTLAVSTVVHAQDVADTQEAMTSSAKIYVVMAVVLAILLGLIVYVVRLDRKISKLEKGEV